MFDLISWLQSRRRLYVYVSVHRINNSHLQLKIGLGCLLNDFSNYSQHPLYSRTMYIFPPRGGIKTSSVHCSSLAQWFKRNLLLKYHPAVVNTYEVMALILSLVNFSDIRNISCATSGSEFWSFSQLSLSISQATQLRSACTVAVRSVSEKNGSSPQVVPATMLSK